MKKKNLLVLLIIPFLISTLTIVSVNITYNLVDIDISYIEWEYEDIVAYQISDELIPLKAVGVNQRHNQVSQGNNLVWKVVNEDGSDEPYAEIVQQGEEYFLKVINEGNVVVTCSNQKGNVSRSFNCIVFKDGYIFVLPAFSNSSNKVDNTIYYGEYDFNQDGQKVDASFDIIVECGPSSVLETLSQDSVVCTDNMKVNIDWASATEVDGAMRVNGSVDIDVTDWTKQDSNAMLTVTSTIDTYMPGILNFEIVKNGYNVYNYDQLLDCTNRSKEGEIVVLQVSFYNENSYSAYYKEYIDTNGSDKYMNFKCMGDLDGDGKADFALGNDTVYPVKTKYNHVFIDQWNKQNPTQKVGLEVLTGLYVQQDFYGNGHSINFHDLTYPTGETTTTDDAKIPALSGTDLFRGPKPFYTVGDPSGSGLNLITAYGQDNSGMYAKGNLVINDVMLQNCDDVESLSFLETVGTVLEIDTDLDDNLEADYDTQIVVKNCRLSNGKNVVRSFSSNLFLDNCMLTNAQNFLFFTGSNKYAQVDGNNQQSIISTNGTVSTTLNNYLSKNGPGNAILDDYLSAKYGETYSFTESKQMQECLYGIGGKLNSNSIQAALTTNLAGQFKGSATINDCIFRTSGIASIALESLFNGPFLYNNSIPDTISALFDFAENMELTSFSGTNISGTSYPVKVTLSGSTKFYDYKKLDSIDLTGLVHEDISTFLNIIAQATGNSAYNITIDEIFPIKNLLNKNVAQYGYNGNNVQYQGKVNIPVVFYGGGANYSQLEVDANADLFDDSLIGIREGTVESSEVNLLDRYMYLPKVSPIGIVQKFAGIDMDKNTLIKTVTIVTGYEPFEFVFVKGTNYYDNYLSQQEVDFVEQLRNNAK